LTGTLTKIHFLNRQPGTLTDTINVAKDVNWINQLPEETRGQIVVKLTSAARRHFKAVDAEASLTGGSDSAWKRYRDSQQIILNSLEETGKNLLQEFVHQSTEAQRAARSQYDHLETELRTKYEVLEAKLTEEYNGKVSALDTREQEITEREKSFDTKEGRYVSRKGQQDQIEQIKGWLEGWSLTHGTTSKRRTVTASYLVAIILTASLVIFFNWEAWDILKAKDFSTVAWWQWVLLALKSTLPLALCATLVIYFIRWSAAWARQHAEEEFRNRARLLDIGRTAWLIEAVRDAQDNDKQLPDELLKDLSRNLFAAAPLSDGGDINPQSISDMVLHGLSSIRVKAADGSEFEAARGSKSRKTS
jgi:hypothetical protein